MATDSSKGCCGTHLSSVFDALTDNHVGLWAQEKSDHQPPHSHLHGGGAWLRNRSGLMDLAATYALVDARVAQALVAVATTRDIVRESNGSGGQIHKYDTRVGKLVPEKWKEWQYQFQRGHTRLRRQTWGTSGDRAAHGTRRGCLGELEHGMSQEKGRADEEVTIRVVQRVEVVDLREANKLARSCEEKEEASRQVQPEDAGEPHRNVARRHQAKEDQGHARGG